MKNVIVGLIRNIKNAVLKSRYCELLIVYGTPIFLVFIVLITTVSPQNSVIASAPKAHLGQVTIEEKVESNPFFLFEGNIINKNFISHVQLIDNDKHLIIGSLVVITYDDPNAARNKFHELKQILNTHIP